MRNGLRTSATYAAAGFVARLCPWCNATAPGGETLRHLFWQCPAFSAERNASSVTRQLADHPDVLPPCLRDHGIVPQLGGALTDACYWDQSAAPEGVAAQELSGRRSILCGKICHPDAPALVSVTQGLPPHVVASAQLVLRKIDAAAARTYEPGLEHVLPDSVYGVQAPPDATTYGDGSAVRIGKAYGAASSWAVFHPSRRVTSQWPRETHASVATIRELAPLEYSAADHITINDAGITLSGYIRGSVHSAVRAELWAFKLALYAPGACHFCTDSLSL